MIIARTSSKMILRLPHSRVLEAAARVIEASGKERPADSVLRSFLKAAPGVSRPEGREVARAVFAYFRWYGWLDKGGAVLAGLKRALELDQAFCERPGAFSDDQLAECCVPAWVASHMPVTAAWLRWLQTPPSLWLRAQSGRTDEIMDHLGNCQPLADLIPGLENTGAIRYVGPADLFQTEAFQNGLFELQDLSSQVVGWVCDPKPGQTWWDACAGEGGKTLQLSDLMGNKGLIWASDRAAWRLAILKRRAARARSFNYRSALWQGGESLPTKTKFDGVLVDAPCSGVGTWQRNPHGRWTVSPEDVRELAALQHRLLSHASQSVKPGGRLIYSVCTLTTAECDGICNAFTAAHPMFEPAVFPAYGSTGQVARWSLKPPAFPGNGMFIACWRREPARV